MRKVRVEAPASSANLGPGFDVFGLALDVAYDVVEVEVVNERRRGIEYFEVYGKHRDDVPRDSRNIVYRLAEKILEMFNRDITIGIRLEKNVRPRSGLGSSGASSAAITSALLTLLNVNVEPIRAVEIAALGEELVTGSRHADNVAPSMLGGFVVIRRYDPLDLVRLEPPNNLGVVIVIPKVEVPEEKTKYARSVLPEHASLRDVIHNVGHASYVAIGFALKNINLIARGMNDVIVEPRRMSLIPGGEKARRRALEAGALATAISGAGPSLLAIYDRESGDDVGHIIGKAMIEGFNEEGVDAEYYVTRPSAGPRVSILS
ncbi:MAG: homoserine kinase [Crenarchaeota archaeon]|nr:homoserine kinase [Thermoproteota archaeon]